MVEEDQESHPDEPEEQEPIKVSVTFKPQEQEADAKFPDNPADKGSHAPHENSPSEDHRLGNVTCHDSETEEPRLPINPPVTPIPSYLEAKRTNSQGSDADQPEVLQGWRGYSNNIYIQPIVVNNSSCDSCPCSTHEKSQRRLINEDLRKQIRLQEANCWITKHNDRIRSTGTLRTRTQLLERDKQKAENSQRKTNSKIHKGFVCKTWANKFLPKNAGEKDDDEMVPFFVRKYVDNSESACVGIKKGAVTLMKEMTKKSYHTSAREGSEEPEQSTSGIITRLEIKARAKPSNFDEDNNEMIEDRIRDRKECVPRDFVCFFGEEIIHERHMKRSKSTLPLNRPRLQRSRSTFIERMCVALPIKQFPPINPLEGIKKPNPPASRTRGFLQTCRPHTVDTALLSKEAMLVNGRHNLRNYGRVSEMVARVSLENTNKEKVLFSRIRFEKDCLDSKTSGKMVKSASTKKTVDWRGAGTCDKNDTRRLALHEKNNIQGGSGRRCRSMSDPHGKEKSVLRRNGEDQNVLCRYITTRLPVKTPPHSLNSGDNNSNTDSNDTGLGSEIEYALDGSAKLDVYLQPRSTSCH